jgi:hypothetical protein
VEPGSRGGTWERGMKERRRKRVEEDRVELIFTVEG